MARAYVLYLRDDILAPCLEVIRKLCKPRSRSLPHVTVRYPVDKISERHFSEYESAQFTYIDTTFPGTFDDESRGVVSNAWLACQMEELEAYSYKPDFPSSIFHLSVYDGPKSRIAFEALQAMRRYDWHFHVDFPPTRLSLIDSRIGSGSDTLGLTPLAASLLGEAIGGRFHPDFLREATDRERISAVGSVCDITVPRMASSYKKAAGIERAIPAERIAIQPDLWGKVPPRLKEGLGAGVFLTPPEIASQMVDLALSSLAVRQIRFGDPSIGSGALFAALLHRLDGRTVSSAIGVEVDPLLAKVTASRWARRGLEVVNSDFLGLSMRGVGDSGRNLILANPPYIRASAMPRDSVTSWGVAISRGVGIDVSPSADAYVYMLLHSHEWLADDGVAVWLIPSSILVADYAKSVREYLTRYVTLIHVHEFNPNYTRFENARVTSCMVVYRKAAPMATSRVTFSRGADVRAPKSARQVSLHEIIGQRRWTGLFSRSTSAVIGHTAELTLGELFVIRRGIATGANELFCVPGAMADLLDPTREFMKPLLPRPRQLLSTVVRRLPSGEPDVAQVKWLIDTNHSLAYISSSAPRLAEYLVDISATAMLRTLVRRRSCFYSQEVRAPAPFLFGYMSRLGSTRTTQLPFVLNYSVGVVLNHYLCLYPKIPLSDLRVAGLDELGLLELLRTIPLDAIVENGRAYGDGLVKAEPHELARFSLSGLSLRSLKSLRESLERATSPATASVGLSVYEFFESRDQ